MKIGILGGTFNPPHIGHLILAQAALGQLQLDKVFFIPANKPPHKDNEYIDPGLRLKMVQLAIEGNAGFGALDIEIKRKGISYTVDTLVQLKSKYPKDDFYLLIGSDLANNFDQWEKPDKIKKLANVVVVRRKATPLKKKRGFVYINITQIDISSSKIRKRINDSQSIKYLVPGEVEKFIKDNNLYL